MSSLPALLETLQNESDSELPVLVRALNALHREQEQLDREILLLKRLRELARQNAETFSLQSILQQIPAFATKDLGFERAILFLDDRKVGVYTARASDGYFDDESRNAVQSTEFPTDSSLVRRLRSEEHLICAEQTQDAELLALVGRFLMDRFLVFPLFGVAKNLIGILVAGNTVLSAPYCVDVQRDSIGGNGLAMLAEQAASAINNCILHWDVAVERNLLEAKVAERTKELSLAYGQIQEDLEQARDFQQSILRRAPHVPGLDIEVVYRPFDLVGGDVYDIDTTPDGRTLVFVADATGHGVRASLTTMFIKSEYDLIKRVLRREEPKNILRTLNDSILETYGRLAMRFTAICVVIDLREQRVTWATAGHPGPCLYRDGTTVELNTGGPFMGLVPDETFPQYAHDYRPGDGLYVFTDGAFEVWNPAGQAFPEEQLPETISKSVNQGLPPGENLYSLLQRFAGGAQLHDDFTFVGLRFRP